MFFCLPKTTCYLTLCTARQTAWHAWQGSQNAGAAQIVCIQYTCIQRFIECILLKYIPCRQVINVHKTGDDDRIYPHNNNTTLQGHQRPISCISNEDIINKDTSATHASARGVQKVFSPSMYEWFEPSNSNLRMSFEGQGIHGYLTFDMVAMDIIPFTRNHDMSSSLLHTSRYFWTSLVHRQTCR